MGKVGPVARALGYAGLLPQVAAVGLILLGRSNPTDLASIPMLAGYILAVIYSALILSFLGGMWWGFAMRRSIGQGRLASVAVLPSLIGLGCAWASWLDMIVSTTWPAITLGTAVLLTLIVDRHLVSTGEAPDGWMRLRAPLSIGLGGLTIAAGVLVGL